MVDLDAELIGIIVKICVVENRFVPAFGSGKKLQQVL